MCLTYNFQSNIVTTVITQYNDVKEGEKYNIMTEIKITLRAARVNAGLSQEDVCKVLGVSKPTLVRWEQRADNIKASQLKTLSELYNIPINAFIIP